MRQSARFRRPTLGVVSVAASVAVALSVVAGAPRDARADDVPASAAGSTPSAAQEHYTAGRESYRLGLYGRALEEFERSSALAPSPNTRLYIARSLRELGRWAEASEQYAATVREAEQRGGKYLATRDAASVELADVKVRLGRANANASGSGGGSGGGGGGGSGSGGSGSGGNAGDASGKDTANTNAASPSSSANATSSASAPAAAAGSDDAAAHRGPTALTWVSGAVAVAGAASFGVLYGLAGNRFGYLEDNCAHLRTSSCDDARTTGKTEEVVAYSALGVAVVAGAITVYSLLRSPSSGASASSRSPSPSLPPSSRRVAWPLAF